MSDPSSCPPLRKISSPTGNTNPPVGVFLTSGASRGTGEPAALRRPLTKGGSRHDESAHSVSGDDSGGFDDPRHARIRRGHHDPGRSLLQTGSSESASARGGVQRDHGHSGGRDGERRAGARLQLPADQLREPGISAGIYDRLRSGITSEANANVVLPANASRSRASQSYTDHAKWTAAVGCCTFAG